MQPTRNLWRWLAVVFVLSFAVLGWLGREIYLAAPPIPTVKTDDGTTLYTKEQIQDGQRAWLAAGGQQLGTVWGHGSYVAPDWSADWLHREALALRDVLSRRMHQRDFAALRSHEQAAVDALVKEEMRRNTYDAVTDTLTVSPERAAAIVATQAHYEGLFGAAPALDKLREQYAMMPDALPRAAGPPRAFRLLLLVGLVRRHGPPRRDGPVLHEQLAARAHRRQRRCPPPPRSGPS